MYATNAKYEHKVFYYRILKLIYERGELNLSNVGFLGEQQNEGILGFDNESLA